jgi:hypothetical protein
MAKLHLVPECHAETAMVRKLFMQKDDKLNHAPGIQQVGKVLEKKDNEGFINIGFIDNDKQNVPKYFSEFELIAEITEVSFKKHPESNDYIFVAKPAIEKFILNQLNECGLQLATFNFPTDFKDFKRKMKKSLIENNEDYHQLLHEVNNLNPSGILFIKNHLRALREL